MTILQDRLRNIANALPEHGKIFINSLEVVEVTEALEKVYLENTEAEVVIVSIGTLPFDKYRNNLSPVNLIKVFAEGEYGNVFGHTAYYVHSFENWWHATSDASAVIFPIAKRTKLKLLDYLNPLPPSAA